MPGPNNEILRIRNRAKINSLKNKKESIDAFLAYSKQKNLQVTRFVDLDIHLFDFYSNRSLKFLNKYRELAISDFDQKTRLLLKQNSSKILTEQEKSDCNENFNKCVTNQRNGILKEITALKESANITKENPVQVPEIRSIVESTLFGIEEYLKKDRSHLGFFTRLFDGDRGFNRAQNYQLRLAHANKSESDRLVEIYALLSAKDGKTLQGYVAKQLVGSENISEARDYIRDVLYLTNPNYFYGKQFLKIDEKINKIVKNANSFGSRFCR